MNYPYICLFTILTSSSTFGFDKLQVAFQWKLINFDYPSDDLRQDALRTGEFIPENNLPLGIEVYDDRLFITIPRWKGGVAASLAYIKLSDPMDSPKLRPYPNWSSHRSDTENEQIISPFRIRADSCGRLWVLDTGISNILEDNETKPSAPPKLLIYNLRNDQLMSTYIIPDDQKTDNSLFANIAVEESNNCEDSYAYLADLGTPALVVYSLKENRSWMVKHHYFSIDPLAGNMNVAGIRFQWTDGLFGLALSEKDQDGFSTLYFHPMSSFNEFTVSTRVLRDEILATNSTANYHDFKILGTRGNRSESGASFLHKKTNVLFYSLLNLNAVACWRTTNPKYTMESQGRVFKNESIIFPNDLKVDKNDVLWVLFDNLPTFMYGNLDYSKYNFRILNATVADAIRGTTCDSKMVIDPDIVNSLLKPKRTEIAAASSSTITAQFNIVFIIGMFHYLYSKVE